MSSGACRALVSFALVLALLTTFVTALPVAARSGSLNETSIVTYTVNPENATIDVTQVFTLDPVQGNWQPQPWGPIVVEQQAQYRVAGQGSESPGNETDVPGPWKQVYVDTRRIPVGEKQQFRLSYQLRAEIGDVARRLPARIDESYFYVCVPGQDTDRGSVELKVEGSGWVLNQSGTVLEETEGQGFEKTDDDPATFFTCIEGRREHLMHRQTVIGPDGRDIDFLAWANDQGWLRSATTRSQPVLLQIREFLGQPIPGEGPVIVRETPNDEIGGYASAHDSAGVVQLDDLGGTQAVEHQLAHAWFGRDNVTELWLREGLAEWIATAMLGEACPAQVENPSELDLSDWQVIKPSSPSGYEDIIASQKAAACGIVSALRERMPESAWDEVIGSLLSGETKYIGTAGPEIGTSTVIDHREFLDAVDERGLMPAADDPAYAANGEPENLDFAQDLLDTFGIPQDLATLEQRSEARRAYHQFLLDAAPLGAPHAVRKDMDDWEFERAMSRLEKSYQVFEALTRTNELLPEVDVISIVQPSFEAARDESELDEVVAWSEALLEGAEGVEGPLGDLDEALPDGWVMPKVVRDAMFDQQFDQILQGITPAVAAAREIAGAHEALPQSGLLERYRERYENAATPGELDELTSEAAADRRDAERAGAGLAMLQNEVGDWQIPAAVTALLEAGDLKGADAIIGDARRVVASARAADLALPEAGLREEIRPQFEAVGSAAEMAALRTAVDARRTDAEAVGSALSTLSTLVGDWQIPAIITEPVAAGDFGAAVAAAAAAQRWVTKAYEADLALPEIDALDRARSDFEAVTTVEQLQEGAELAGRWAEAAAEVKLAIDTEAKPRDMLTSFGLMGVDVRPLIEEAKAAAIAGDVQTATQLAGEAIATLNGGSSAGSLRLAGIIFFGVAVVGVLGLWIMLRRQAGPKWARSTTPHWVDEKERRGLFSRKPKPDKKSQPKQLKAPKPQDRRR